MTDPDYHARISFEIARYACSDIRNVPPIYDYWMDTYIRPKLNSILRVDTIRQFYVEHIIERGSGRKPSENRIVSLGSGDAELEIQIATDLLSRGLDAFSIDCLELSPALIDRANRQITAAGLVPYINVIQSDLNSALTTWSEASCAAVVANHILHHVVDLEGLFANIRRTIGDSGVFLTADMIGRNGHRRWPESLSFITALWAILPDDLRYNHILARVDQMFDDYDCLAAGGFEGIRAQDVLPLLIEHFQFEKFLAFGCLPEVLFGSAYGPNFDPELLAHRQFVGSIDSLNTSLLELGILKPTMVFAVMSSKLTKNTRIWKMLSPEFCVRNSTHADGSFARQKSSLLANAHDAVSLRFQDQTFGSAALLSGWGSPEEWGIWMVSRIAVMEIRLPPRVTRNGIVNLTIRAMTYLPKRLHSRSFTIVGDDGVLGTMTFLKSDSLPKSFMFTVYLAYGESVVLRLIAHEDASPAEDGSQDCRSLGLGVVDVAVQRIGS